MDSMINFRCILEYRQLLGFCKQQSNFAQDIDSNSLFSSDGDPDELQSVTELLKQRGCLTAVLRLSLLELHNISNPTEFERRLRVYDMVCETVAASREPSDLHRVLSGQLSLLGVLLTRGASQDAETRLGRCKTILKELEEKGLSCPSVAFQIRVLEFKISPPLDLYQRAIGFVALADVAPISSDYPRVRQNLISSELASRESLRTGAKEFKIEQEFYMPIILRRLQFERNLTKSAFWLAVSLCDFGLPFLATGRSKEYVKYSNDFLAENDSFDIPFLMYNLASIVEQNAGRVMDNDGKIRFRELGERFAPQCPFAEKRSDEKFALTAASKLSTHHYQKEIVDQDQRKILKNAVRLSLYWASSEARVRRLGPPELHNMFGVEETSPEEFASRYGTPIFIGSDVDTSVREVTPFLYGTREMPSLEVGWSRRADMIEKWLRVKCEASFEEARHYTLKMLQLSRLYSLRQKVIDISSSGHGNISEEAYEALFKANEGKIRILRTIDLAARGPDSEIHDKISLMESIFNLSNSVTAMQQGRVSDEMLREHMDVLDKEVCDHFRAIDMLEWLYMNLKSRVYVALRRSTYFKTIEHDASLKFFEEADRLYCNLRRNASTSQCHKGLDASAFHPKHSRTQQLGKDTVYILAILGCLEAYKQALSTRKTDGAASSRKILDQKTRQLSMWIERSKARTLLDEMGIGARIPARLLSIVESKTSYQQFLAGEDKLISQLEAAEKTHQPAEEMKYGEEIQKLRDDMQSDPSLREIMSLRDGVPVTQADIEDMLERLGPNVALVSYFFNGNVEIWVAIYRNAHPPQFSEVNLPVAELNKWVAENLGQKQPLDSDDAWISLAKLNCLIDAVGVNTDPGDTIVLCPTKVLHRISLHLLKYSDQLLIERNPVVYCQSLSDLQRCQMSAEDEAQQPDLRSNAAILCALRANWRSPSVLSQVHTMLDAKIVSQDYIPTLQAIEAMTDATMLYFHGHAHLLETDDQADASNGRVPGQYLSLDDVIARPRSRLTAEQVFQISLHTAALVVLIACRSGESQSKDTDDLFGLSTAFLYAGATSVMFALWKIDNDDGIMFSKKFFSTMEKEKNKKNSGGSFVKDIAVSMQKALLQLRNQEDGDKKMKTRYHWGAFTLNGFWQIPASFTISERLHLKDSPTFLEEQNLGPPPAQSENQLRSADGAETTPQRHESVNSNASGAC